MSYASLSQFKAAVGITDTTDDAALQNVLDATDTPEGLAAIILRTVRARLPQ